MTPRAAPTHAMVLAAGFGTRMGALTKDRPKPLIQAAGRALIDHTLDLVASAGARHAVVNLHYRGDQIRQHLRTRPDLAITYSEEQPEILDTGGGIAQALPALGASPFYVLNSDAVFAGPNPLTRLAQAWAHCTADILMLLVPKAQARAYTRAGDFFLEGGVPVRRGSAAEAPMVYSGAQIVSPAVFRHLGPGPDGPNGSNDPIKPFSMNLIWDRLLEQGRIAAIDYAGLWVDVGTPDGLHAAELALAERPAHVSHPSMRA